MKTLLISLAAGVCLLAQAPAAKPPVAKTTAPAAHTAPAPKTATSARPPQLNRALLNPALLKAKAPELFKVKFVTTKGDVLLEIHRDWAPLGADRFYNLVKNGFFTDAAFFRVLPDFVVQFGLSANPQVNKAWETAKIADDPVKESNRKGTIVFATAGPGTRTTQLFINLKDNPGLDPQGFSPFGTVVEGMDVVEKINPQYRELPQQDRITAEGKPYLDKNFPSLDMIKTATVIAAPAPAPATSTVKRPGTTTSTKPAGVTATKPPVSK